VTGPKAEVRAAGGVVHRPVSGPGDDRQVLVVHRPRYDDWTFPKGKLDPGETEEEAACREVAEETGLTCRRGEELALVGYRDARGRTKTVRYWAMTVLDEDPAGPVDPDEVDELAWVTPEEARARLSYERDVAVLDAFEAWARTQG
jgi:8-oxo-dGTP diphosphatase